MLCLLAVTPLVAACGSDSGSSTTSTTPTPSSVSPPTTTVPTPVGSTSVELRSTAEDAAGDAAVWELESAAEIGASSTTFVALVTRLGCSGGITGEVLEPTIVLGEADVVVTFFVAALDSDVEQTCPDNDRVRYEVTLGEPIGQRQMSDGSCLSGGQAASTSFCAAGAVRWSP